MNFFISIFELFISIEVADRIGCCAHLPFLFVLIFVVVYKYQMTIISCLFCCLLNNIYRSNEKELVFGLFKYFFFNSDNISSRPLIYIWWLNIQFSASLNAQRWNNNDCNALQRLFIESIQLYSVFVCQLWSANKYIFLFWIQRMLFDFQMCSRWKSIEITIKQCSM